MAPQEAPPMQAPPRVAVDFPRPGIAVVWLIGEQDLRGKQRLIEALETAGVRPCVLVDLSACTFIDSTVIGALFLAHSQLVEAGGRRLELVIPPEATTVRRVAEITLLGSLLTIHRSHAKGLASLQDVKV
jgi:anti-sigma B factor antagonist